MRRAAKILRKVVAALVRLPWPDLLQWAAILGGWALLTWGVSSLTAWQVWPISGGVLLLSVAGWGHLHVLFGRGLYALTQADAKPIPLRKHG